MNDPTRVRASSLWEMLDCALRWRAKHLDGLSMPSSAPAAIGTAVHASTAAYDLGRMLGDDAMSDAAIDVALDSLRHPEEDVDWQGMPAREREATAARAHQAYTTEIGSRRTYLDVELGLDPLVIDVDGYRIELTGTADRLRQDEQGRLGMSDVKTGKRAVGANGLPALGHHGPQLGVYDLLAEATLGVTLDLPPEIVGLGTGSTPRAGVAEIPNARATLIGSEDAPGFLDYVAHYLRAGVFPPNPGSLLCSPRYCPLYRACPYHP